MARNKEALVMVLDVGPSMHALLPEVEKVCSMLVQKKLIFGRSDEVGIILFGTKETDNDLEKEVGGYQHVVVLRNLKVVDGDAIEVLHSLPRGSQPGDFIDAIVVGMDMLIKKFGQTDKGKKCLCLISDLRYPIKEPYEGTKEDQVAAISEQMNAIGMKLEAVVIRGQLGGAAIKGILEENDHLMNLFSAKAMAKVVYVDNPTSVLGAIRTRNISPVTVYRGDFELSPMMKIKVWVYKKTSEEKFPTLKKYSDKAPPTDKYATHEVKVDFEYKSVENPDEVVPPEQRIKGYRYGPQVVPISSVVWDELRFKPEKSVKLLGFTDASNVLRHYYMKDVYLFIPEPGNKKAAVAVSAIARAMKEMNKVAILRCVWRQGQGNVAVGVLRPNLAPNDKLLDSFYFNILPFAEDVREFQFPSFSSFPSSWQPDEKQQQAADDLVRSLDLAPSDHNEVLRPDFTPNPVLERFYRCLDLKSKLPEADVPPLDETLKRITEPDPFLLLQNKSVIDNFRNQFELKESSKKKRSSTRAWREKPSTSKEDEMIGDGPGVNASNARAYTRGSTSSSNLEKISDQNPIQDFEAMIARRDSSKWVTKAIKLMQDYINDLLENSYKGDVYPKAIQCLVALRKGCVLEQEPKEFNNFLQGLYDKWKNTDLLSFFNRLSSENITLISKSEAIDSDVTEDEARNFPVKAEPAS